MTAVMPAPAAAAQRADGVELLGPYLGSGTDAPTFVVRRADGQMAQLTSLLYLLLEVMAEPASDAEHAERLSVATGREVTADDVAHLVDTRLVPLGLAVRGGAEALAPRPVLALALSARRELLSATVVRRIAGALVPLFARPLVWLIVAAFVALDVWMIVSGRLVDSLVDLVRQPERALVVALLAFASIAAHELGHAAACLRGGGRPGGIGFGLYVLWPAFYTDVTDSYRLSRRDRLRVDLGGVYLNAVFGVVMGALYLATGFLPFVAVAAAMNGSMLEQLLPYARFDGYWVMSDLAGVPDLFPRFRPALASLRPGKPRHPLMAELRPGPRRAVTAWAVITAVVLPVQLAGAVVVAPVVLVAVAHAASDAVEVATEGDPATVALGVLRLLTAGFTAAALVYGLGLLATRSARSVWPVWAATPPRRRAWLASGAAAAAVALLAVATSLARVADGVLSG